MKTILLMRHSTPDKTKTTENAQVPLSAEGIVRAKTFFKNDIFQNIHHIYASPYLRAMQTAYLFSSVVTPDERLIERKTGDALPGDESFWKRQYEDYDFKAPNGESFNAVRMRMTNCMHNILTRMNEEETVLIVSHAAAICCYLMNFCSIEVLDEKQKNRKITFQNKIVLEGKMHTPSCFILRFENNRVADITYYGSIV